MVTQYNCKLKKNSYSCITVNVAVSYNYSNAEMGVYM